MNEKQAKTETKKKKRYEELTFADDFMFCKIMQTQPELCKELVELIIGRRIRKIVMTNSQKAVEITADAKGVRFDVYLEDDEKQVYDIEMQQVLKEEIPRRMRYYQGMVDLNLIERGEKYKELRKSYIIFISLQNLYPQIGLHKYTFLTTCQEKKNLIFEDLTEKILISAEGTADDVSEEMAAFLNYLKTKQATSEFTRKLDAKVEKARAHREWQVEYMTLQEKLNEARKEGIIETLISLVKDGIITLEDAAARAGVSEEELQQKMAEN